MRQYGALVDDLSENRDKTLQQMKLFVEVQVNGKQKEITNNINLLETAIQDSHDVRHPAPPTYSQEFSLITHEIPFFNFPRQIRIHGTLMCLLMLFV